MKFSKIDLSSVKAIAHDESGLKLVIEREREIEIIEIAAPVAAYDGLQLLDRLVATTLALPTDEIDMLPVCSSMAARIGYNQNSEILQIEFESGSVYQYSEVAVETWAQLQSADSIGSFYNSEIKGQYPALKVEEY